MRIPAFLALLASMSLCATPNAAHGEDKVGYLQPGEPGKPAPADLGVFFSGTFRGGVVTGGVGLRGTGSGTIAIGGIPSGSKVFRAFLYWDTLADTLPTDVARINGKPATGRLIGKDASPCWPESSNFAFRADVTGLVSGNGNYLIEIPDSGDFNVGPSVDGASLVVVFKNPASPVTSIKILDGDDLIIGSSRTNVIPRIPRRGVAVGQAKLTFIVADGQAFEDPIHSTAFCNGAAISDDKAFNASDGMLWDDITYDVTDLVEAKSTSVTAGISAPTDCLVWIAAVYAEQVSHLVCAPGKVDVWVDAANLAGERPPYATRGTAASTINKALAVAKPGSVIFVLRGTYPEQIVLGPDKAGVTLAGDTRGNCDQPTIDGQFNGRVIDIRNSGNITICGFNIVHGLESDLDTGRGGGVRVLVSDNVSLADCCFEGNQASFGGAVYAERSFGFVRNCLFQNGNQAQRAGGAMAIKGIENGGFQTWSFRDCRFEDNVTTSGPGGAIAVFGDNEDLKAGIDSRTGGARVNFRNCSFLRNAVVGSASAGGNGGAFYSEGRDSKIIMKDVTFESNEASAEGKPVAANGGAVAAGGVSTITITGRKLAFTDNHAPDGGACYATTLGKIEVIPDDKDRATFMENTATSESGFGGAFHLTCGGIAILNQCDFSNNVSENDGGALHSREARIKLDDCKFLAGPGTTTNLANRNGGAIALRSVESGNLFCNRIPSILEANNFTIDQSEAKGLGGAIFSEFGNNLQFKVTQIALQKGVITRPKASAEGLSGRTADGIYMRETGETQGSVRGARLFLGAAGLRLGFSVRDRYFPGTLDNLDTIQGVNMVGRSGAGSAITAYQVCNEEVPSSGPTTCDLSDPDIVLRIFNCDIQGFRVGIDAFHSSRVAVLACPLLQNGTGVGLELCVADVKTCGLIDNTLGIHVTRPDDLLAGNVLHVERNVISGGQTGIQFDTNAVLSSSTLVAPGIEIHENDLTGHSAIGSFGILVDGPFRGFAIDAERNWWGSPTGPNPPTNLGANPNADNVGVGVDFADPLPKSHGRP